MFESIYCCGICAGTLGINILAICPRIATNSRIPNSHTVLVPARIVPKICPNNMDRKVPLSIRLLPLSSSYLGRYSGNTAYFNGPNKVECVPIRNRHNINIVTDCIQKPIPAISIMQISAAFIQRARMALSILLDNSPDNAEKRKKGRIYSRAPAFSIWLAGNHELAPSP